MKKSNKVSMFYIFSSVALFLLLFGGGFYGVYLSVGLSFVRNGISNITDAGAMNVSFGGTVNFSSSMIGVIMLSIGLIVLAVLDLVSLFKQLVLFKQFKLLKDSSLEKSIEKKVTNKTKVIFFAIVIDIISFIVGIAGILLNSRTFPTASMCWPLYLIDALVSILAVTSIVLLIIKLKGLKRNNNESKLAIINSSSDFEGENMENKDGYDIDEIEYKLLKLRQLKSSKIINAEEYANLRNSVLGSNNEENEEEE
ncbi:MAG: hypothetical protein IJX17_01630 [Clostridia bacterium]|nr:hypothetical protein [Clostridia bacterium]